MARWANPAGYRSSTSLAPIPGLYLPLYTALRALHLSHRNAIDQIAAELRPLGLTR
jgi:hypothetical protein